jgi:hypothetical protein
MNNHELRAAILNLKGTPPEPKGAVGVALMFAYKNGHRDARHAAAELVLTERENVNAELLEAAKAASVIVGAACRCQDGTIGSGICAACKCAAQLYRAVRNAESISSASGQSDV